MSAAIVTGAESSIGRAIAVTLARRGYDVGLTWQRSLQGALDTAEQVRSHGSHAAVRFLDSTHPEHAVTAIDSLTEQLGGLEILVNNAGTGQRTHLLELDMGTWRHVLDVDLTGVFATAQAGARRMVRAGRGGRIVNVTSVHEQAALRTSTTYCAAHGGLDLLTKAMAVELAEHDITVNSLAPGEPFTAMTATADRPLLEQHRPARTSRADNAHELATAVDFLVSPEASYINGASFLAGDGMLWMAAAAGQLALDR